MAIISTAEYQTFAGISGQAAQLNVIIPAVQAQLERYCCRAFDEANHAELTDGKNTNQIILANTPIESIEHIRIVNPGGQDDTLIFQYPDDYYTFDANTGIVTLAPLNATDGYWYDSPTGVGQALLNPVYGRSPCFPLGVRNIKVNYAGGYASAAMPPDLKLVMYQLTAIMLAAAGSDTTLNSEQDGEYSYSRGEGGATAFARALTQLAAPWRRWVK